MNSSKTMLVTTVGKTEHFCVLTALYCNFSATFRLQMYVTRTGTKQKACKMTISKLKEGCASPRAMFRGDTLAVGSRTASDLAEMRNGYLSHTSDITLTLHQPARSCLDQADFEVTSSFPHLNICPPTVHAKFIAYLQ